MIRGSIWSVLALLLCACGGGNKLAADQGGATPAGHNGTTGALPTATSAGSDQPGHAAGSAGQVPTASNTAASEALPPLPGGLLTSDTIAVVVERNFGPVRDCYIKGLDRDPAMAGWIDMSLTIGGDGSVVSASAKKDADKPKKKPARRRWRRHKPKADGRKLLTDTEVVSCVEGAFMAMKFPPTGRGLMTLVYRQMLATE